MDLLLFQRQVIMWILCTKFFLIGEFWQIFTVRKVDKILSLLAQIFLYQGALWTEGDYWLVIC